MTKFISKRDVRELVLYSFAHTARLEKAGRFPARVRLGPNRVGYVAAEIEAWIKARIAQRDEEQLELPLE